VVGSPLESCSPEDWVAGGSHSPPAPTERSVREAVENGAGGYGVAEHFAPSPETLVAGDDDRAALIAP
jgi:hypothetical protein